MMWIKKIILASKRERGGGGSGAQFGAMSLVVIYYITFLYSASPIVVGRKGPFTFSNCYYLYLPSWRYSRGRGGEQKIVKIVATCLRGAT
jgi:hypothetical protein